MISTTATTSTVNNIMIDSATLELDSLTLISDTSSTSSVTTNDADNNMIELEKAIHLLEDKITPLTTKVQKKIDMIEDEIANCNFLIDSGLGSKKDQAALRKKKKQLRQRRVKLRDELKVLPSLKEEKIQLERQLRALCRQLGVIDDDT